MITTKKYRTYRVTVPGHPQAFDVQAMNAKDARTNVRDRLGGFVEGFKLPRGTDVQRLDGVL